MRKCQKQVTYSAFCNSACYAGVCRGVPVYALCHLTGLYTHLAMSDFVKRSHWHTISHMSILKSRNYYRILRPSKCFKITYSFPRNQKKHKHRQGGEGRADRQTHTHRHCQWVKLNQLKLDIFFSQSINSSKLIYNFLNNILFK